VQSSIDNKAVEEAIVETTTKFDETSKEVELTYRQIEQLEKENALYAEKVQINTDINEFRRKHESVRIEYEKLCNEFNLKDKQIQHLHYEIEAKSLQLARIGEHISKEREKQLDEINKKLKQVNEDAEAYNKILKEVLEKERKLNQGLEAIDTKEKFFKSEIARMERHIVDTEQTANSKWNEATQMIEDFNKEKAEFEAYKLSLEPELDRISELKNENNLLVQKINNDLNLVDKERSVVEFERGKMRAELEEERAKLNVLQMALLNRETQLKEQEQNLKDLRLELDVKEKRTQQMIKRYNLQEEAKQIKEDSK
jgi:chromosome segregation ATPase